MVLSGSIAEADLRFDRLPGTAMLTADGPPESYRATLDGSIPCDGA